MSLYLPRIGAIVRWPFRIATRGRWMPDAICLGFVVIYWVMPWPQLAVHEASHGRDWRIMAAQAIGPPWLRYVIATARYLVTYAVLFARYGYRNHPMEVKARSLAGED